MTTDIQLDGRLSGYSLTWGRMNLTLFISRGKGTVESQEVV